MTPLRPVLQNDWLISAAISVVGYVFSPSQWWSYWDSLFGFFCLIFWNTSAFLTEIKSCFLSLGATGSSSPQVLLLIQQQGFVPVNQFDSLKNIQLSFLNHTQSACYVLVNAGLAARRAHTQTHTDFIIMSGSDPKEHLLAAVFQIREETLTRFLTLLLHRPHELFIPHFLSL